MKTEQFYWREAVLVVVGVGLVALLQADFVSPNASSLIRGWIIHGLWGALYALIGSATTYMAATRQRHPTTPH